MTRYYEKPRLIYSPEIAEEVAYAQKEARDFSLKASQEATGLTGLLHIGRRNALLKVAVKSALYAHQQAAEAESKYAPQILAAQLTSLFEESIPDFDKPEGSWHTSPGVYVQLDWKTNPQTGEKWIKSDVEEWHYTMLDGGLSWYHTYAWTAQNPDPVRINQSINLETLYHGEHGSQSASESASRMAVEGLKRWPEFINRAHERLPQTV
jgi:hypothetical protein